MSTFYGSDTSCVTDLGLIDQQITNPQVLVGQRIARRLTTPHGALAAINDDPDFGFDIRQFMNGKVSPKSLSLAKIAIQAECLKDETVSSADVTVNMSNSDMVVNIALDGAAGPFALTLNIDKLKTELVFVFGQ